MSRWTWISIGGMRNGTISNVNIENMTATGGITHVYSSGGLRVKSYPNGKGYAYDILYKDIILDGVYSNSIIRTILPMAK